MTPTGFRKIALSLDGAIESAHQNHPDFRANGRIFATLGYPDRAWGMVVLTPDQQGDWTLDHPDTFVAVKGKWGERGCTSVRLEDVTEEVLGEALTLAWQNTARQPAPRQAARRKGAQPKTAPRSKR